MAAAPAIGLGRLLAARDERAGRQAAALARFERPLVSVTLVTPGAVKDGWLQRGLLASALDALEESLERRRWRVVSQQASWLDTGPEALYVVDAPATALKQATVELEEGHPLGRLWDLDVIARGPRHLSRTDAGAPPRRCLVCGSAAIECARSRRHGVQELMAAIHRIAHADTARTVA